MSGLDDELMGLDGKPIQAPGGETMTLRELAIHALLNPGVMLSEAESLGRYELAKAIAARAAITSEMQAVIIPAAAKILGPLALGRVRDALVDEIYATQPQDWRPIDGPDSRPD